MGGIYSGVWKGSRREIRLLGGERGGVLIRE